MAYIFREPTLGQTPINATAAASTTTVNTSTVAFGTIGTSQAAAGRSTPGRLGSICKAYDPVYGEGEFIYLKGVASTAIGTVVLYDQNLKTTTIAPATGGIGPVAIAMSANVANQYGWYQIGGAAVVLAPNAMVPGAGVYMLAATPGSVDDAVVAGELIQGAVVSTTTGTPGAGFAVIEINRPSIV